MKQFDVHMKNVHFESENLRIIRLTKAVVTVRQCETNSYNLKMVKILDCSECGEIFSNKEDSRNHNKIIHSINCQEDKFTKEEIEELYTLHEEAMAPSQ